MRIIHTVHSPATFRAVDYRDDPAVYTVSTRLRETWVTDPALILAAAEIPSPCDSSKLVPDIGTVIRAIQSLSINTANSNDDDDDNNNNTNNGCGGDCGGGKDGDNDGKDITDRTGGSTQTDDALRALRNADKDTLHTPLRDAVYYNWNHVFWDVTRFLLILSQPCEEEEEGEEVTVAAATSPGKGMYGEMVGHMHPPTEEVFAVEYPKKDGGCDGMVETAAAAWEKVFETNVLLAPTFVEEGVDVRVAIGEGEQASGFNFDARETRGVYNEPIVYWIRKGERVRMTLSGKYGKGKSGVAAVFVLGKLCECLPEKEKALELQCHEIERSDEDGTVDE
ncbi:uncharacterized protein BKCO1_11000114 [Diplodia corticola]|uniref:Uncharacterized protein n=1 Tax=Diplodia corticola TaxID=236234 RepID=A0A1J9RV64_9PEZI|nr:uncharacterized protein BKCO1_11000114 [Diplodia corticola]OJD36491.1 hypothetical protein BKCO1_11000114 [Diplodia corticola]